MIHGNDLIATRADALDDHGKGAHALATVAAAVMQEDDVSAALIVGSAGRQVSHYVGGDLLGGATGIVAPVVGIDLVADGDVTHALGKLKRAHLICGIGLLVHRIGRTEQYGVNSQTAGEQALRQIQLQLHESGRDVADIRVGESVIADLMTFVEDAAGDR